MSAPKIKFWGVRGSVPTSLTSADIKAKHLAMLEAYARSGAVDPARFIEEYEATVGPFAYGGNTSCVEVVNGRRWIQDMGTGLRPLGNALFKEMVAKGGLEITFVISHVHWDHIQGLPFFGPLHMNKHKDGINNKWRFLGGTRWQKTAEACLAGQMDPPNFPVSWEEIEMTTGDIKYGNLCNGMVLPDDGATITFYRLDHPQETYGSRYDFGDGKVFAYTTDNEPRNPMEPYPDLIKTAWRAKVWATDCQYSKEQYEGREGGVPRHGWGHSYPEAVAKTAVMAEVETVVLFHHDPAASEARVRQLVEQTQHCIKEYGGSSTVIAAYEGLEIEL